MTEERFEEAKVVLAKLVGEGKLSDEEKLSVYAWFKQATEGDVKIAQPSMFYFKERAKWDAWNSKKGTSSEVARQEYINLVFEVLKPKHDP